MLNICVQKLYNNYDKIDFNVYISATDNFKFKYQDIYEEIKCKVSQSFLID